jgi:fatty acid desaturase
MELHEETETPATSDATRRGPEASDRGGTSAATALSAGQHRALQRRSDTRGLVRFAGHLGAIFAAAALYAVALRHTGWSPASLAAAIVYGFTLVTMFAPMHESVHRTAFRSLWLNNTAGWIAGLLSFYNSTFYRHYHGWHHRFTQLPGKDPELDDPKPTSLGTYLLELMGVNWWTGKLRGHTMIARGRVQGYGFLNDRTRPAVVRSVRAQLLVYGVAIVASIGAGYPYFVVYWLLPVALGQPLLRAILLAEHTGCSEEPNALTNTRTTYTLAPIRFLMWNMPYHAEHHRYPAVPFFALETVHRTLGPGLRHVARGGYIRFNLALLRGLLGPRQPPAPGHSAEAGAGAGAPR